jgi:DNA-binding SARP family transcriptional activator
VYEVQLVDDVRVLRDGGALGEIDGRPARLLLVWLALHPGRQPRTHVAAQLWPDVHPDSARTSLRAALASLRRSVGDDADGLLVVDREAIGLAPGVEVDRDRPGELAPGLPGEWLANERDRHRTRSSRSLAAAVSALEADGDLAAAAAHARERVEHDPFAEAAVRELVRLTWLAGDRAGALEAYDRFRERLRSERGVAPSPETRRLIDDLRAGVTGPTRLPQVPLPAPLVRAASTSLVGRESELRDAQAAFERIRQGGTGLLLVAGEPGIGKTRLAAELAARAGRAGASVLAGRVAEDALVPYQAWVEALAGYLAAVPREAAAALTARDEAALARILPGIPTPPAPAEDRFRLLEAVASLLSAVSHDRPSVIVLDDLHWAEQASLVLLRHVLRWPGAMRLLLVATYRESELGRAHPLSAALADLRRDTAVDRIRLRGLDARSTAALAPDAPAALALAVHRRTGGNPFFARELFRNAAESGADGLPEGVREVIGHRLDRLGPDAGEALAAAAVIGPRFGVDDVDDVLGRDPLPALERALAAGLLREDRDGSLAFAHALVQETLLAELSTVRRVRLHRQVAEVLAARGGDVSEIARHRFEAAAGGGGAEAAAALVAAGDAALAAFAYETAAAHFWRAIEVDPSQRSQLLLRVGDALLRAGETQRGRAAYLEAAELARTAGDRELLARAALGRSGIGVVIRAVDREQVALLEEALEGTEDEALRAALLARLAVETYYDRDLERRMALADEAAAIARRLGDPATLAAALNAMRVARWDVDHLAARRAISEELIAIAVDAGDAAAELQGRNWLVVDLLDAGERDAAEEEIARYEVLAERHRMPAYGWYVLAWRAALADADGRTADADRLRAELDGYRDRGIDPNIDLVLRTQHGVRRLLRGEAIDDEEEVDWVRSTATQPHVAAAWHSGLALMEALRGDHAAARYHLAESGRPRDAVRDVNWPSVMWEQGATAVLLDDPVLAREVRELLAPFAGMTVTAIRGTIIMGPAAAMLARLDAYLASVGA